MKTARTWDLFTLKKLCLGASALVACALSSAPAIAQESFGRVSTRAQIQSGENVLVSGLNITGDAPKRVLVRLLGPSLGLPGSLANPTLQLIDSNGEPVASNDNWREAGNAQDIEVSGQAPPDDRESAILTTLPAGNYTAVGRGVNNTTGIANVDIIDQDASSSSKLAGISSRAFAGTGDNVIVGGFEITGSSAQKVLIRGTGPSLPSAGKMENPTLELRDSSNTVLVFNNNWKDTQQADIEGSDGQPVDDRESVIVATLAPGTYTAVLAGVCSTTGVAFIEIYNLGVNSPTSIPASSEQPACANQAPTSTNLQGNSVNFTEDGDTAALDTGFDATLSDDNASFNGGTLTVRVANKVATEDQLFFSSAAGSGITASGNVISVDGVEIGTFAPGGVGVDRTFSFNSNATPARVQKLIRQFFYFNVNNANPTPGQRTIQFILVDGGGTANGGQDTLTITTTVTVTAVNDAPTADSQSVTLDEDTSKAITLTASDVDSTSLTFSLGTGPTNGTLSGTAPNLTYTPNANYTGTDSFTFQASDGEATSNLATVSITVNVASPAITSASSATATVGQQFTYQIVATNDPDSYSATNLPPGLSFDPETGVISGEPTETGSTEVTVTATNAGGTGTGTVTITVQAAPPPNTPVITSGTSATARTNDPFQFQITASGVTSDATVTSTTLPPGLSLNSSTGLISGTPTSDGSFQLTLTLEDNGQTATGSLQLTFTSDPAFPVITSPSEVTLVPGQPFSYQITAPGDGSEPAEYSLSGTLPPGLTFDPATGIISGTYTPPEDEGTPEGTPARKRSKSGSSEIKRLQAPSGSVIETVTIIARNSHGTATASLTFLVPRPTAAVNISTRGVIGTGENVLIAGFIVSGDAPKEVIIRAIGPSLSSGGEPVGGRIEDTVLELFDGENTLIRSNDDWETEQQSEINDSTVAPSDYRESAILITLAPGNYTAKVRGKADATGIGLVEVYDLDTANDARLAQISTRGDVQRDDNVLIGGFIISGAAATDVLIRAIGPELQETGVENALEDTTLELRDADGELLAENDDWKSDQEQAIRDTTAPPKDDREAAIVHSLSAGRYTAIVRGKNDTTGIGLVEVYVLK